MSLDIDLYGPIPSPCECVCESCGNKHETLERTHLAHFNLTHNLTTMANESFLYDCLWNPSEIGIEFAHQIIPFLKKGLALLEEDPDHFKIFSPKNGYGSYENLVNTVKEYLVACEKNPEAIIEVDR